MPDTTTPHGQLILTVFAEFEHDLIRARSSEGRERAKAQGVKLGRKPILMPHLQKEARNRLEAGETQRSVARSYIGLDGSRRVQAATSAVIFI